MATATHSIREIISTQPTAAAILQRFDIDGCAHANDSVRDACADQQLSVEQVLEKLQSGMAPDACGMQADPAKLSPSRLIQHIVRVYHRNVRQDLPRLVELARFVSDRHGDRAPELKRIQALTEALRTELVEHIRKEEQVLFPYIAELDDSPLIALRRPQSCLSRVGQPVFMMAQEHEQAKLLVAELRELGNDFKPPVWACSAFVALYSGLRVFAGKLDEHIRLENDVLFPQAIELESQRMGEGAR